MWVGWHLRENRVSFGDIEQCLGWVSTAWGGSAVFGGRSALLGVGLRWLL